MLLQREKKNNLYRIKLNEELNHIKMKKIIQGPANQPAECDGKDAGNLIVT